MAKSVLKMYQDISSEKEMRMRRGCKGKGCSYGMFEGEGVWVGEIRDDEDVDFGREVEEAEGLVARFWFCGREEEGGSGRILVVAVVEELFGHFLQEKLKGERCLRVKMNVFGLSLFLLPKEGRVRVLDALGYSHISNAVQSDAHWV